MACLGVVATPMGTGVMLCTFTSFDSSLQRQQLAPVSASATVIVVDWSGRPVRCIIPRTGTTLWRWNAATVSDIRSTGGGDCSVYRSHWAGS